MPLPELLDTQLRTPDMTVTQALKNHGIEHASQRAGEPDVDCAKRWLTHHRVGYVERRNGATTYLVFSRLTISAIAAKVTLESPLEGLLRVQPFLEFIDGDIASY